jgi:hypothetical protein
MDGFDPGTAEASITRALGIADGVRRRSAADAPGPDRMATGATCMVTAVTAGLSATLPTRVAADGRADPRTRREVAADRAAGGHHNGVDGEDACPPDIQGGTVAGCGTGIPRGAAALGAAEAGSRGYLGVGPTARSPRPGHPHQQRHGRSSTMAAINAATTVRRRPHPIRLRRSAPPTGPASTARGLVSASSASGTHPRVAVEGPPPRFAVGIRATPAATMAPPRGRRTAGIRHQQPSPAAGAILGKIGGRDGCGWLPTVLSVRIRSRLRWANLCRLHGPVGCDCCSQEDPACVLIVAVQFPWDPGGCTPSYGWCLSFRSQKIKCQRLIQVKNNKISRHVKGLFFSIRFVSSRVIVKVPMQLLEDELLEKGRGNVMSLMGRLSRPIIRSRDKIRSFLRVK